jgi:hypothetical protein
MLALTKPQRQALFRCFSQYPIMGDTVQTEQHHAKNRVAQIVDSLSSFYGDLNFWSSLRLSEFGRFLSPLALKFLRRPCGDSVLC